jgi:hypothetical protein
MSYAPESLTECADFVCTVMRQCNSCPVCHLPLVYGLPARTGNRITGYTYEQCSDLYWAQMQNVMKEGVQSSAYYFGTAPDARNAQKCHFVASTLVPEITRPKLYETPARAGKLYPESGMYLFRTHARDRVQHQLVRYDLKALFRKGIPTHRLMRLSSYLSTMGTRWFLGCADCNVAHTGHWQLNAMVNTMYPNMIAPGDPKYPDMCNMYTVLFDSLADYDKDKLCIQFTQHRCNYWQVEVWLTWCTIMFIAQHIKSQNHQRYLRNSAVYHIFHNAHKDMGLCDFYMSQIICIFLYAYFDIDVDFITLHQRFLVHLPQWAAQQGLFDTPSHSYRSLWRLVLGRQDANAYMSPRHDTKYNGNTYDPMDPNNYWIDQTNMNLQHFSYFTVTKIVEFAFCWVPVIGTIIDTRVHADQLPVHHFFGPDVPAYVASLRKLWDDQCSPQLLRILVDIPFTSGGGACNFRFFIQNMSLKTIETMFNVALGSPRGKQLLYYNMLRLAMRRMEVGYDFGQTLASPEFAGSSGIQSKFERVLALLDKLALT